MPSQRNHMLSREQQAHAEVGVTRVSRRAAASATLIFLITLVAVPMLDMTHGRSQAWKSVSIRKGQARQTLRSIETTLEEQSLLGQHVRPAAQTWLLDPLRAGSEQVCIGKSGWLFYRPDVRHVTMRGFLDPASDDPESLRRRRQLESPRRRDPLVAILAFKQQLAARGVQLVIVPTPVKPMVHPERLWPSCAAPLANASLAPFERELQAHGIPVFDVTADLAVRAREGKEQYLATDTHWRPEAMELAARRLSEFVSSRIELPQSLGVEYTVRPEIVRGSGDLAGMLPSLQPRPTEEVTIQQVIAPGGEPWTPRDDAEILWLGDSFSSIYSAAGMGWGSSAGFAEQFSRNMGRPVDALRRNDDGAFATRQMLADELARGDDRLAGKKLVIWQFAARELSFGDWKSIPLKLAARPVARFIVPPAGQRWAIEGTIAEMGVVPRPGNVAYREHVLALHLTDVSVDQRPESGEAVVYVRSMIDGTLTEAARLQVGQRVRMMIRDWSDVARQYEFVRRSDLPEPELRAQPPCWGELVK